jgi:DNA-binding NtrC family response regulator
VDDARLSLARREVAVVLADQDRLGVDGLRELAASSDDCAVIALSSGGPAAWRDALIAGAAAWFERPLPEPGRLVEAVRSALASRSERARDADAGAGGDDGFLWRSPAMRRVAAEVARLAPTQVTVLVTGETGTGKEGVARALHRRGDRSGEFVEVNCGALPPELVESELFGHERGAFTGATERRPGLVANAAHGTLFLDEIGDLRRDLQVKLLRFLDTGRYRAVGATGPERESHVRLVAATHRDLAAAVEEGSFRADLYHRLSAAQIRIPALRDRPEDVALLVAHFLHQGISADGLVARGIQADALDALVAAPWPGNVRQLRNVVRAASLAAQPGPRIRRADLPDLGPQLVRANPAGTTDVMDRPWKEARAHQIEAFGRAYVAHQLAQHGTVSAAARASGMTVANFCRLRDRVKPL